MTNQYFLARIAGRDPNIRASDEDRERIAERLRKSHAEGRIDIAEFQERLERCYEAKTHGELGELVRDLPRQDEPHEGRPSGWSRAWTLRLAPLGVLLLALIAISAMAGHHHGSWLWIPIVFIFLRMTWWRRRRWSTSGRRGPGDWI
jgi:hypothetical protein